jgi:hypothetical protein
VCALWSVWYSGFNTSAFVIVCCTRIEVILFTFGCSRARKWNEIKKTYLGHDYSTEFSHSFVFSLARYHCWIFSLFAQLGPLSLYRYSFLSKRHLLLEKSKPFDFFYFLPWVQVERLHVRVLGAWWNFSVFYLSHRTCPPIAPSLYNWIHE